MGKVIDVRLNLLETGGEQIIGLISIQPQRLNKDQIPSREAVIKRVTAMVESGLRAQLKIGNFITGALYIDLVNAPDTEGVLLESEPYPKLPTLNTPLEQFERQIGAVMDKLQKFPLEQIAEDLQVSMSSMRRLLESLASPAFVGKVNQTATNIKDASGQLTSILSATKASVQQLEQTLVTVEQQVTPESELHYELLRMLNEVSKASVAVKRLSEELERNPNKLIFGQGSK